MGKAVSALGIVVVFLALGVVVYVVSQQVGTEQPAGGKTGKLAAQAPAEPQTSPEAAPGPHAPPALPPESAGGQAEEAPGAPQALPEQPPPLLPEREAVPEEGEPERPAPKSMGFAEGQGDLNAPPPAPGKGPAEKEPPPEESPGTGLSKSAVAGETSPSPEAPSPGGETTPAPGEPTDVAEAKGAPAPAVAREGQAKPAYASYVIKEGDTLWSIAVEVLGDGTRWKELLALNPGLPAEGGALQVGQTIKIPSGESEQEAPQAAPKATWPYTVKPGDTLAGIAKQFYGDPGLWLEILAANPGLDPDALAVGSTVKLPEIQGKKPQQLANPAPQENQ